MTAIQSSPVAPHEVTLQTHQIPRLRFNRGKNVDLSSTGWMLPTPKDTPLEEMRRRYEDTGYLWVKHLLPREDVYDVREQYVQVQMQRFLPYLIFDNDHLATSISCPQAEYCSRIHHQEMGYSTPRSIQWSTRASVAIPKSPVVSS